MKKLAIALFLITVACQKKNATSEENYLLKPKVFQEKFVATPGAILLDVRTLEEVRTERIKDAVNFDFNLPQFDILIAGLDKSKTYFVYCASGVRSARAAEKMHNFDIEKVYLLDGGIKAWKSDSLPTVSSKGARP